MSGSSSGIRHVCGVFGRVVPSTPSQQCYCDINGLRVRGMSGDRKTCSESAYNMLTMYAQIIHVEHVFCALPARYLPVPDSMESSKLPNVLLPSSLREVDDRKLMYSRIRFCENASPEAVNVLLCILRIVNIAIR